MNYMGQERLERGRCEWKRERAEQWLLGLERAVGRSGGYGGQDLGSHTHIDGVVMELFAALETRNVGTAATVTELPKRGDRSCEPLVAAAKQQVKHRIDHGRSRAKAW